MKNIKGFKSITVTISGDYKNFRNISDEINSHCKNLINNKYYPVLLINYENKNSLNPYKSPQFLSLSPDFFPIISATSKYTYLVNNNLLDRDGIKLDYPGFSSLNIPGNGLSVKFKVTPEDTIGLYKIEAQGKDYIGVVRSLNQSFKGRDKFHIDNPKSIFTQGNHTMKPLLEVSLTKRSVDKRILELFTATSSFPGNLSHLEGRLIFETKYIQRQKLFNIRDEGFAENYYL